MGRAKLPREGRNRQVPGERAADLLHQAPDKFKVMRGRAAQHERRPAAPHAAGFTLSLPACPFQPSDPAPETSLKTGSVFPGRGFKMGSSRSSGAGLARAGGHSGRRGESEDLLKVAFKEQPHCFSQTILSRWEN